MTIITTLLKAGVSVATGGISSIFTNWKAFLLVLGVSAIVIQTARLSYSKHAITKLTVQNQDLQNQLASASEKLEAQKNIVQRYSKLITLNQNQQKQADQALQETLNDLAQLPDTIDSNFIQKLNKRLACELANFNSSDIDCKDLINKK